MTDALQRSKQQGIQEPTVQKVDPAKNEAEARDEGPRLIPHPDDLVRTVPGFSRFAELADVALGRVTPMQRRKITRKSDTEK